MCGPTPGVRRFSVNGFTFAGGFFQELARLCRRKLEELEERERKRKEKAEKVMNANISRTPLLDHEASGIREHVMHTNAHNFRDPVLFSAYL